MTPNLDRQMFLVICDHKDGLYIPETDIERTGLVRLTKDILQGQYNDIVAVIEFNPTEHTCKDATDEFREVIDRRPDHD